MIERLGVDEDPCIELSSGEREPRAVLQPDRVDVPRLIAGEVAGLGCVQDRCEIERAGQFLIDVVHAGVKARLDPVGDGEPDIAVEAKRAPLRMIAVAVRTVDAERSPRVARPHLRAGRDESAPGVEAADIAAQVEPRRSLARRRHAVDRAAERARAEAQCVGAAIDFEIVEEDRLQFLKIAVVVGEVDRHPVLQQRDAAHVVAARQPRPADRDPHLLPVARLEVDARRERERVAQRDERLVGIFVVRHDIGAAGGSRGARFGFVRRAGAGDDDGAAFETSGHVFSPDLPVLCCGADETDGAGGVEEAGVGGADGAGRPRRVSGRGPRRSRGAMRR